jgi:nicotinate dehydrogenase subunit A
MDPIDGAGDLDGVAMTTADREPRADAGTVSLSVNGRQVQVQADPTTPLLAVLRGPLGLSGPRFGCGLGLCGACFVRLDGAVVASCETPVWAAEGHDVVTVEGLADGDHLHPVQQALLDAQAAQCGYCICGIAVSAATLLEQNPHPTRADVTQALDRNLCRCGSHRRIVDAILSVGEPT